MCDIVFADLPDARGKVSGTRNITIEVANPSLQSSQNHRDTWPLGSACLLGKLADELCYWSMAAFSIQVKIQGLRKYLNLRSKLEPCMECFQSDLLPGCLLGGMLKVKQKDKKITNL